MTRVWTFVGALTGLLYLILYTEQVFKISVIYGNQKIILNFWFVVIVLLLGYLSLSWMIDRLKSVLNLPSSWKSYRKERLQREAQFARGQALMYGMAGKFDTALSHLPGDACLQDLVLKATWLNQLKDLTALESTLSQIQASKLVTDEWMIWFRAYLLNARGKQIMASELLLEALDTGLRHELIVQSFVDYASVEKHYGALLKHFSILKRYVSEEVILDKVRAGVSTYMDVLIAREEWSSLDSCLSSLPKKLRQDRGLSYYMVKSLMVGMQDEKALDILATLDFEDSRLIGLVAELKVDVSQKIMLVGQLLNLFPRNKDLIYLMSYLHVQDGELESSVKMLENAWGNTN